uniref:Uncharacterized protein n=1 Tax=Arundo donax TaxID=35708 RepID=A0A0A9ERW4_ARUDO
MFTHQSLTKHTEYPSSYPDTFVYKMEGIKLQESSNVCPNMFFQNQAN